MTGRRGSVPGAALLAAATVSAVVAEFAPLLLVRLDSGAEVTVTAWGLTGGGGYRPPEDPVDPLPLTVAVVALIATTVIAVGAAMPWATRSARRAAAVCAVGAAVVLISMTFATAAQVIGWAGDFGPGAVTMAVRPGAAALLAAVPLAIIATALLVNAAKADESDPA